MSGISGTQTEKHVLTAYLRHALARSRYDFFAKQAKKDGYEQMAGIFTESAEQERALAKRFAKYLKGGSVELATTFPADALGKTADNLRAAAASAREAHAELYPAHAEQARADGLQAIAMLFESVAVCERVHEARFVALLANIEADRVFRRDEPVKWFCRKCGYIVEAEEAPAACPACAHPQAYFEVYAENY